MGQNYKESKGLLNTKTKKIAGGYKGICFITIIVIVIIDVIVINYTK